MFNIKDKVAVITGGSSGMGEAAARRFVAAGAKVVVADLNPPQGLEGVSYIRTDVCDPAQIAAAYEAAIERHGRLDIAINNAGIGTGNPLENIGPGTTDKFWQINGLGAVYGMKEAAARMHHGGSIINTASLAGIRNFPYFIEYSMTKAAVISATQGAAIELGARNIRVNCICPGPTATPLVANAQALVDIVETLVPLRRMCKPEEIAALMHFLASDDAAYISGQAIVIDGAWSVGTSIGIVERCSTPAT